MFSPNNRITSFDYEGQTLKTFSHVESFLGGQIGGFQNRTEPTTLPQQGPSKQTLEPSVTGTSVVAIKYKDGVMMAADTLASYGSLARFRDLERISKVGKYTILGASGDISDLQYLNSHLDELITGYDIVDDGSALSPESLHSYITRLLYARRNKFDPLWNMCVVAGFRNGKSFLGWSDLRGSSYTDDTVATGYGNYIARPLLRSAFRPDLSRDEALNILETCMKVLFFRDARSLNRIQVATITEQGANISAPYELATDWSVGEIYYSGWNVKNS